MKCFMYEISTVRKYIYGLVPDRVINILMNIAPSSGCSLEPYNLLLKVSESYFCDFSEKVNKL